MQQRLSVVRPKTASLTIVAIKSVLLCNFAKIPTLWDILAWV